MISGGRRRRALWGLGLVAGLAAASRVTAPAASSALDAHNAVGMTTATPIQHVVVVMEENHSFDDYFGTFPGAHGIPAGVCVTDPKTKSCDPPYHNTVGFTHDLPHWASSMVADIDGGKMDGFVAQEQQACNCSLHEAMSYVDAHEIPIFWRYAEHYTLHDNLFEPIASWSYPAHLFMVSEWSASCKTQTDPLSCSSALNLSQPSRTTWPSPTLPWTDLTYLLHKAGIPWGYYVSEGTEPDCDSSGCVMGPQSHGTPSIWNPLPWFFDVQQDRDLGNIKELSSFFTDVSSGNLPAVSWVIPNQAQSGHPGTGGTGPGSEAWVVSVINAIESSSAWSSTAIVLAWDDWGGMYDHVVPPVLDSLGFGLRVPSILISPYAKAGYIDHQLLSFDAYNKFIEDNFLGGQRLDPKSDNRPDPRPAVRENNPLIGDLMNDFDFSQSPAAPLLLPALNIPSTLQRGTQVTVSGVYFLPNDSVKLVLNCGAPDCANGITVATVTAAADGTFTASFTVPTNVPKGSRGFMSAMGTDPLSYFAVTPTSVS